MEYVHARKIIHRDLKPENIVFEENGYVHITDFGVARKYREANS
jgi:serum/glucocorticoid-regulated kinase 2